MKMAHPGPTPRRLSDFHPPTHLLHGKRFPCTALSVVEVASVLQYHKADVNTRTFTGAWFAAWRSFRRVSAPEGATEGAHPNIA